MAQTVLSFYMSSKIEKMSLNAMCVRFPDLVINKHTDTHTNRHKHTQRHLNRQTHTRFYINRKSSLYFT